MIEAQDWLVQAKLMDWPNIKQNERNKIWGEMRRLAFPPKKSAPGKKITNEQLARVLAQKLR